MQPMDLSKVGAGFSNPVHDSQMIFRQALDALSHPGRAYELIVNADTPEKVQPTAAGLLLALLDSDSRLWLSESIALTTAAQWLIFHTNCAVVTDPQQADFAWIASLTEMPEFGLFNQGTDEYPEQSTTCLININQFNLPGENQGKLTLSGPGILDTEELTLHANSETELNHLINQCELNHKQFPKGIDIFLCSQKNITGLPRTTKLTSA